MDASLLIDYKGNITEVNCRPIMTIGRDKKNDIVVHDSEVSRNHAVIRVLGGNAEDSVHVDVERLSSVLSGIPVFPVVATTGLGVENSG